MKTLSAEKLLGLSTLFGLSFLVLGWFSFSLALGGLFYHSLIAIGFILCFLLSLFIAWKLLISSPLDMRVAFVVSLLAAVFIGMASEPTIFSGRDQGSIAEAAYRLAENNELAFSTPGSDAFFQIYQEGKAYNFPGFAYTTNGSLITQFPLGYTSWLAGFVSLFGLAGFAFGNAVLFFLFLFFLYQLIRLFAHPYYAGAGLLFALTSFLPNWFAKLTLSENLAVFLFVFLCYNLVLFFREGRFIFYAGILLSAGLFAFTRIEGFAFLFLSLALIVWHPHTRALIRTYPWKTIVIPGVLFAIFFLRDFFMNLPYYKVIGKALDNKLSDMFGEAAGVVSVTGSASLGSIFFLYGLLALALLGFFGLLLFLKRKQWLLLIPAFIALPTFFYLFQPSITPDHPWMLRRYLFSLYPTLLFSAVMCIAVLFARKDATFPHMIPAPQGKRLFFVSIIFLGLIMLQYPAWSTQLFYAEHRGLQEQVTAFANQFSEKDLILVDNGTTGDGFSMLSGPGQFLYGKNTVYFFNPLDLDALDTSPFERVYLVTPDENQARYASVFGERLVRKGSVTFTLERFELLPLSESASRLPEKEVRKTSNTIFQVY